MRKGILIAVAVVALLLTVVGGPAFASGNPSTTGTGQPSQTCLSTPAPMEPGNAGAAPGSAFNENGGIAGGVYAGNGQTTQTPANGAAVSQYDVACFQVSQSH